MFTRLNDESKDFLVHKSDLGINALKFISIVESFSGNNKFLDLGVDAGKSSAILLHDALEKNNHVWGVDVIRSPSPLLQHPNYTFIRQDSIETAKEWDHGPLDIIFVDTVHAKEQTLLEIRYWWPLLNKNEYMIFHDTNWEGYVHRSYHPAAGKQPGTSRKGYDYYGGIAWETPDKALLEFFNIKDLNYSDEFIISEHAPKHLGMTFIHKLKHKNYDNITNWDEIIERRDYLMQSMI